MKLGRKNILLFLLFFIGVFILYYPSRNAGFVTDFLGWQSKMDVGNWKNALKTFGWHDNLPMMTLVMYWMYCLFGLNGWWWFFFSVLLHAINGVLAYSLFSKLLRKNSVQPSDAIAISATLLFLFSPYQAEALVWRVCFHYLVSAFFTLSILHLALSLHESFSPRKYFLLLFLFALSLLTFELALATPLLIIVFTFALSHSWIPEKRSRNNLLRILIPQLILIVLYFVWNKISLGNYVGHYGAAVHLNANWKEVGGNFYKYFVKNLLFTRFLPYNTATKIYDFVTTVPGIVIVIIILALLLFGIIRYQKLNGRWRVALLSFFSFFIALIPVITLYMVTLLLSENDRYGYIASIFFWMAIAVSLSVLPKSIYFFVVGGVLCISVYFTFNMIQYWNVSNKIFQNLLSEFQWYDRKEVVLLNTPDNFKGVLMSRIYGDSSGFKEALDLLEHKKFNGKMTEITQFNMATPNDGVSVKQDSLNSITVTLNQWGNWWWRNGIGASNYENDDVKVQFDGQSYYLHFKRLEDSYAILYQDGEHWKEFVLQN